MKDVELVVKVQQFLSPPKILLQFDRLIAFLSYFLDALASLDLKLSVTEWVIYRFSNYQQFQ